MIDQTEYGELKQPPHSKDAEISVIGGLLQDASLIPDISEILHADAFYQSACRLIYDSIIEVNKSQPVDVITVSDYMQASGDLDRIGGMGTLIEYSSNTPGTRNIMAYCKAINDKYLSRQLITRASEIVDTAYSGGNIDEQIEFAQTSIMSLNIESGDEVESINSGLKAMVDGIDERFNSKQELVGLTTGFADLDKRTQGLCKSDLIIIAGRPSMGKTTLAMNIVEANAIVNNVPTIVFSMEMSRDALLQRMTASAGNIPFKQIRTGKLWEDNWAKLTSAVSRIKDKKLVIDDRSALTVQQMARTAKKYHKKVGLGLIVVDYIQLAQHPGANGREQEISGISRGLKALAKDLNVPVVALSQLNRGLESRPNKRPLMSDLRESGAIEQDADVIVMLYRDEVYDEDSPDKGVAEVITRKQRNGETGTDKLCSRLDVCKFQDMAPQYYAEDKQPS